MGYTGDRILPLPPAFAWIWAMSRNVHLKFKQPVAPSRRSTVAQEEIMLARAIVVAAASTLLAACVDSDRLRSHLGGPTATAEADLDAGKHARLVPTRASLIPRPAKPSIRDE
jgi:hypothetical protein